MLAYHHEDRALLIGTFEVARRTGHASSIVRLLGETARSLEVHMFDLVADDGVVMTVGVACGEEDPEQQTGPSERLVIPSRLARVHKTRTAEIVDIDRGVTEILGWTSQEMVGRRSLEYLHPDDHDLAIQSWAMLLTDSDAAPRTRVRHRAADDRWVWFDVAHSSCSVHPSECFVADMIDISKEMETQHALEAREQLLAQLAQALPLGIFQVDGDRQLSYANECLGTVMHAAGAHDVRALLHCVDPADRRSFLAALRSVTTDGTTSELDIRLELGDPERSRVCHVSLRGLPLQGASGPGAVGCVSDVTEQAILRNELEDRATFDPLTKCHNRASTMSRLETALLDRSPGRRAPAVLFIDLDRFKAINDRFGHAVGDELLVEVAARIRSAVRRCDLVGRIGGDEFLVVLDNVTAAEAKTAAERLRTEVSQNLTLSAGVIEIGVSVGLARADARTREADDLVKRADAAMYTTKRRAS
jgi:diguanylate cyclase (GGDEF)-like protein/PAS domain S-box-containing protein